MRTALLALILSNALSGLGHADTRVPQTPSDIALSFAPVVREAAPAVVNIYASRVVAQRISPFADDPFFGPLFRDLAPSQPRVQNSLGSGVILSPDGIVVSNTHVVGGMQDIRVVLTDRREFAADILLADEESDITVLRLREAQDLPALELRDSDEVEVGELVLAIGNPFGVGQTVTSGIVSGLARSGAATGSARGWFIQTDAAINPGNSGGALVDVDGRLIGINTSILTRTGASHGIGFAIPSTLVARVVAEAEAGATRFERPWAGLSGQEVTPDIAQGLGFNRPQGFLIAGLHPASPFTRAGLEVGDVLLEVDGQPVNTPQDVLFRLSVAGTGAEVPVLYLRDGDIAATTIKLEPPPDVPPADPITLGADTALPGLSVATLNPRVVADLGLPLEAEGVVVTDPGPRLARVGLRPRDVILAINGYRTNTGRDVERAARERTRGWVFDILRDGRRVQMRFRL